MNNVGFLIPTTSKNKKWQTIEESILFKNTLSTIKSEKDHKYIFFIGYDNDDTFYKNNQNQETYRKKFPKYDFVFIEFSNDVIPGHLTRMWNILLEHAIKYNNGKINYFYQCGDDILFKNKGWVSQCIKTLLMHQNIGITGPTNDHAELLTQVFFSKKHYEIFNLLFPSYIFNWGCDDWINNVYSPNYIYPLNNFYAINAGGIPRYNISNYNLKKLKKTVANKAINDIQKLKEYLNFK